MAKQNFTSWALFILLSIVWGSSFILMKLASQQLTGWQIGATRIFAAGLVFFPFALFHFRSIPLRKLHLVVLSGMLGNLFPAFLFAVAVQRLPSALAGILNSLTPLFVILIGFLFFKTAIAKRKLIGVLIGFVGLLILNLSKGPVNSADLGATALILIATVMYGLNVNLVSHYLKGLDGIKIATVAMAIIAVPAGIIMWQHHVFALLKYDEEARAAIGLAALLGVAGSAVATALFYVLIQKAGPLFASLVTYAIPVVAIFWGLFIGEGIVPLQIACLGLILAGVYLANRRSD